MWKKTFLMKTGIILLLLFSLQLFVLPESGYTMTTTATSQSITIPITEWNALKNDWMMLEEELTASKQLIQKLKKPSDQLLSQLDKAEKMLVQSQTELQKQNSELTMLSRLVDESKTELQTLKQQIDRERKIHKRQIWQNRIWCILIGAGIGLAASR